MPSRLRFFRHHCGCSTIRDVLLPRRFVGIASIVNAGGNVFRSRQVRADDRAISRDDSIAQTPRRRVIEQIHRPKLRSERLIERLNDRYADDRIDSQTVERRLGGEIEYLQTQYLP